jgi:hypothetical protein
LRSGLLLVTLAILAVIAARLMSTGTGLGASAEPRAGGHGDPVKITGARPQGIRHRGHRPAPVPRPPVQVTGQSVTAIGDSVMVASTPALEQDLPGIYINAVVGRQFATGLQVLASLRQSGQLRQIVIFGLGTNGPITASQISQLFAEIGSGRLLVLVNTFADRSWEPGVNATLAEAAQDHPHVVLADWFAAIEHRTDLLWPDGIHPQPGGGVLYAQIVKAAVERVANLPS